MKFNELSTEQREKLLDSLLDNQYLYEAYKWEHKTNPKVLFNTEWIQSYVVAKEWEFDNVA